MTKPIQIKSFDKEQVFFKPLLYIHVDDLINALKHYVNHLEYKVLEQTDSHALINFGERCWLYLVVVSNE